MDNSVRVVHDSGTNIHSCHWFHHSAGGIGVRAAVRLVLCVLPEYAYFLRAPISRSQIVNFTSVATGNTVAQAESPDAGDRIVFRHRRIDQPRHRHRLHTLPV